MVKGKIENSTTGITVNKIFLLLCLTVLPCQSCTNDIFYADTVKFNDTSWKAENIASFLVPVNDTSTMLDVTFNIRTASSYPFRNIFLFVSTISPSGATRTDTIEYYLADEAGRWYGKGIGDIFELELPYRSHVFFPEKGNYLIKIMQGMRMEELKGVYNFGLRINKSENNSANGGKG